MTCIYISQALDAAGIYLRDAAGTYLPAVTLLLSVLLFSFTPLHFGVYPFFVRVALKSTLALLQDDCGLAASGRIRFFPTFHIFPFSHPCH